LATAPLPHPPTSDEDLLDWLQLSRSENIGPLTVHRLLKKYTTPGEALAALPELASRGGLRRPLHIVSRPIVEKELTLTREHRADIITFKDPFYPRFLRHIDSAPPVITVKGRLKLLQEPLFAIVGARNASAMGKKMAYQLAQLLGKQGWIIASGLARGIDGAAHQGSVQRGTVAVLAVDWIRYTPLRTRRFMTALERKAFYSLNQLLESSHKPLFFHDGIGLFQEYRTVSWSLRRLLNPGPSSQHVMP
jgi:predicted Rossmann fold nucleotide-binding protein DprA/Smf involved in DNA uptake